MDWPDRFNYACDPCETHTRLTAVRYLLRNDVSPIIWGEDMLANVFHVPTVLFNLHLLIADEDVQRASSYISDSGLPYHRMQASFSNNPFPKATAFLGNTPFQIHHPESLSSDSSFKATNLPKAILLHPASSFHFDVSNPDNSFTPELSCLPAGNEYIPYRYPTLSAVLESLFASWITPLPSGESKNLVFLRWLRLWSGYIRTYSLDEPAYPEEQEEGVQPEDIVLSEASRKLVMSVRKDMRGMADRLLRRDCWPDSHSGELPPLSEAWFRQFGRDESKTIFAGSAKVKKDAVGLRSIHSLSGQGYRNGSVRRHKIGIREPAVSLTQTALKHIRRIPRLP